MEKKTCNIASFLLQASSSPEDLSVSNLQLLLTYLSDLPDNFLTIEDPALAALDDNNNDKVRRTSFSSSTDQ